MTADERWFGALGEALTLAQQGMIAAMLRACALPARTEIVVVGQWHEALAALRADERDSRWWDIEEEKRERLWEFAVLTHDEDSLLAAVERAMAAQEQAIDLAVKRAAARLSIADPAWGRAARAAALMAVHQHRLGQLAGAPTTHLFALKYRLFADGRWPLGLQDGRFVVC